MKGNKPMTQTESVRRISEDVAGLLQAVRNLETDQRETTLELKGMNRKLFVGNGGDPLLTRLVKVETDAARSLEMHRECPAREAVGRLERAEETRSGRERRDMDRKFRDDGIFRRALVDIPKYLLVAVLSTLLALAVNRCEDGRDWKNSEETAHETS